MDKINPQHYKKNGFEVIDIIAIVTGELMQLKIKKKKKALICVCLGNAIKYLLRCCVKGEFLSDIKKTIWYLNKIVEIMEKHDNNLSKNNHSLKN